MSALVRVAADNDDIDLAAGTIVEGAFLVGGTGDSIALVYDSATVTGTEKFGLKALLGTTSPMIEFENGIRFNTAISVDMTGAGAVLYLLIK